MKNYISFSALTSSIILLSAILWYLLYTPIDISPLNNSVSPWKPSTHLSSLQTVRPLPQGRFQDINTRPVFNKDRKPFKKKQVVIKTPKPSPKVIRKPPPPAQNLRLLGVLINATTKKALIGSNRDKKGLWLAEKEIIQGWKIMTITNNQVILRNGQRELKLPLYALSNNKI